MNVVQLTNSQPKRHRAVMVAAVLTVAYSAVFEFPVTASEVHQRLVMIPKLGLLKPSLSTVSQALARLVALRILKSQDEYFYLDGFEGTPFQRIERASVAQEKWTDAAAATLVLAAIPWVEAVYVTGSLAVNNTRPEADVDFLLVTSPNRLWLTRIWVTLVAWRLGKRRSWHDEEHRSWCFNLWVERDHLAVFAEPERQSLYTAYELIQAVNTFDRSEVRSVLRSANAWVFNFLTLWPDEEARMTTQPSEPPPRWVDLCLTAINASMYRLQRWYMAPHQTREQVTPYAAFFHPRPTPQLTLTRMHQILERVLDESRSLTTSNG